MGLRTQPRRGWSVHSNRIPRVAAWPQPWAGGRNPVGIEIALDVTTHERGPDDQPSIGIILCAEKDDVEVEYALRSKANPIGVAAYELQSKLPVLLPRRGFLLQPRVGPSEGLPWVTMYFDANPTGVVSDKTSSLDDLVRGEMEGGK